MDILTDKGKRDFIADEIEKRIVGPGLTHDVFMCSADSSDEIVDNRPNVIYTSGILFPKRNIGNSLITPNVDNTYAPNEESIEDKQEANELEEEESNHKTTNRDNNVDVAENERPDFEPSHIGMIFCIENTVKSITVDISYGQYHLLSSEGIENNVRVKLGRCSLDQLKSTLAYYDSCKSVRENIKLFDCNKMSDVFSIDEQNLTISPKKIFKRTDQSKDIYLQATSFPRLLRNIVVDLFFDLSCERKKEIELEKDYFSDINWKSVCSELDKLDKINDIQTFLSNNNLRSLKDNLEYNANTKIVTAKSRLQIENTIKESLKIDDSVRDHLLPLLLQYRFFKREPKEITRTIDIPDNSQTEPLQITDSLKLHLKITPKGNIKYVKLQLQNAYDTKDKDAIPIEAYIFQAKMKVLENIIPYTEPHHSSIDDDEYSLNEELYREVPMYGKGVNCGVEWEPIERNERTNPQWISTTYAPRQKVAAFSSETGFTNTDNSCDLYNLTIWSKLEKNEILNQLRLIAEDYKNWKEEQKKNSNGKNILDSVIKEQEDFYKRFCANINYLNDNERAFNCFKIANTAMYIQMIISRDPNFKKNRELDVFSDSEENYWDKKNAWDYFKDKKSSIIPKYRPFQLAFLIMNVKSTFEPNDVYRKDNVDLIWFPTGGGKTEAYLALTALTIAERRTSGQNNTEGISVIMRYTLRLLTAQQFERASFLICAMEYLRKMFVDLKYDYSLGNTEITLGMWIGSAQTPNDIEDLGTGKFKAFFEELRNNIPLSNPFPISYCPWCGCKMVGHGSSFFSGYNRENGSITCLNEKCFFYKLPINYIDKALYKTPPTLLFATVDKFALLKTKEVGEMFGANSNRRKPDLIIQDELHLISGPLGSLVGMFETMIEELCTERNSNGAVIRAPKIIASTATTRNTRALIKQLYARNVQTFPVSGISYSNNFFSHVLPTEESKRLYMGLAPTGHSASELEIRSIAAELVSKEKLFTELLTLNQVDILDSSKVYDAITTNSHLIKELDNYWSLVLYYMNLKSLGRTHSRLGQEIKSNAEAMRRYLPEYQSLNFIIENFFNRSTEFTSRQESTRIKELLIEAESAPTIHIDSLKKINVKNYHMDIVQATNMISVGIDIARWNIIFMIGQPLTTAEYIQSSSRVGRTTDGLIVNIFNSLRNRELSFYENYEPYHQAFYKFVEPLSVTTFTEITLEKLIYNLYLCYFVAIMGKNKPCEISNNDIDNFKVILQNRNKKISPNNNILNTIRDKIDEVHSFYCNIDKRDKTFAILLCNNIDNIKIMTSLRDVESNTYIKYE